MISKITGNGLIHIYDNDIKSSMMFDSLKTREWLQNQGYELIYVNHVSSFGLNNK